MRAATAALVLALAAAGAGADNYRIDWSCVSSGGGVSSSVFCRADSTVGQPAAGFVNGTSMLHWIGFWSGAVPTPALLANVADAKMQAHGAFVSIPGRVATSANDDFGGFFYVEDPERTSGIRIATQPTAVAGLSRGSVVNVVGTLHLTEAEERELSGPIVTIASSRDPLTPLGMPNRSLGGGELGLNNIGLLVRTWGTFGYLDATTFTVNDGGGPITCIVPSDLEIDPGWQWVGVTGISSCWKDGDGLHRLLRVRDRSDITSY